jgi:2-polyprenyl-3-methyl-5-hydroxy-6-metoxy-1,4-benzoquinol methylase
MDRNPRALQYGARFYASAKVRFIRLDIEREALPEGAYDAVLSFETMEHLPDAQAFLGKLHGAVKPGGLLLLSTPNQERMPFDPRVFPFHVRHFTLRQLRELLTAAGFSVTGVWSQPERGSEQLVEGGSGMYLLVEGRKRA